MALDYVTLKNELTNDPKGFGYASKSDNDAAIALNTAGLSGESIFRAYTAVEDIVAAIVRAEYDGLSAADKAYLNAVILAPGARVKSGSTLLRSQVGAIFGAATTTRGNLAAATQKSASRAEALFGEGTVVTDSDIAKARAM